MQNTETPALHRWRTARRITLGAIAIAGTMATATAVTNRLAHSPCQARAHHDQYRYVGVGIELTQDGDDFVVARVFPNTPADGKVQPGAVLLSVDGQHPAHMQQWTRMIRGAQGTDVELELAYPCSGHDTVVLERELIVLDERSFR